MSSSSSLMNMIDKLRATAVATSKDDFTGRSKLLTQIDDLRLAVETPMETLYRVGQQPWQNAAIRIALDIGIFGVLVGETDGAVNVDLLARETKADKALIIRLMRVLVALGLCEKVSPNAYEANDKTDVLTEPAGVCAYKFWFDLCMPTALKMPEYFRKHGNEEPLHYKVSPFAHTFGEEFWTWMSGQTIYSYFFGMHLMSRDYGRPRWFEKYPIEERLFQGSSLDDNAVLIVDVGGNDGQDLVDLREWFPTQHSTLILQDLPYVIDFLDLVEENIICMRHDFFESQPIKGARAYYFRTIFHDWPDDKCVDILRHTADAMKAGYSKLLISESILRDTNTGLVPASLDLQTMGLHAGKERSEKQWRDLLRVAGFEITGIWHSTKGEEDVIEAVLTEG